MRKPIILFLSLLLVGCNYSNKKENNLSNISQEKRSLCVQKIFEKDSIFGGVRNHASEKKSLTETIENYSENLKSLDFTNCPENFESAFQRHVDAWLDFRKLSDKYPLLRGELHEVFAVIEKSKDSIEFKSRLDKIMKTWNEVEKSSK